MQDVKLLMKNQKNKGWVDSNMEDDKRLLEVFDIDGKEYGVLYEKDDFIYTVNTSDKDDIKIFKSIKENEEESVEEVLDAEREKALALFYLEYRKDKSKE